MTITTTTSAHYRARLRLLFCLIGVGVLVVAGCSIFSTRTHDLYQDKTDHSYQILGTLYQLLSQERAAENELRNYVLSGRTISRGRYLIRVQEATYSLGVLSGLLEGDPDQPASAAALRATVLAKHALYAKIDDLYRIRGQAGALDEIRLLAGNIKQPLSDLADKLQAKERLLLDEHKARAQLQAMVTEWISWVSVVGSLLLLGWAFAVVTREQRRRVEAEAALTHAATKLKESLAQAGDRAGALQQLTALGEFLLSCRTTAEVIEVVKRALPSLPACGSGMLGVLDQHGQMDNGAAWGTPVSHEHFDANSCWALRRGRAHPQSGDATAQCGHLLDSSRAALCLPLSAQGQTFGILCLAGGVEETNNGRDIALAASEQIALTLANVRLHEQLSEQSLRDPLTGLHNRRHLSAQMTRKLEQSGRDGTTLAVVIVDIDHFKAYNDTHGHSGGDALLVAFARMLEQSLRAGDVLCRYGGEEFVYILPKVTGDEAMRRAGVIMANAKDMRVAVNDVELPGVGISVGIAMFPGDGTDAQTLIKRADAALYESKRGGRGVITLSGGNEQITL